MAILFTSLLSAGTSSGGIVQVLPQSLGVHMCFNIPVSMDKWYIYTIEYFSVFKNEIMKFTSKWVELRKIILSNVIQIKKDKFGKVYIHLYLNASC